MLARAIIFLLDSLAGFLSLMLLLRFFMQAFRVSFANPLGTFVLAVSNWLVLPLRRLLPGIFGLDLASLLPAYLLQLLPLLAALSFYGGLSANAPEALIFFCWQALRATLRLAVYLMIGALIVQAVLSWISPWSPLAQPVGQLTQPLLRPVQRFLPPLGNVDLSPLVVILALQLVLVLL